MGDFVFYQLALGDPALQATLRKNQLLAWVMSGSWFISSGATFNGTAGALVELMDFATVLWPNGVPGRYTLLQGSVYDPTAPDSYSITYEPQGTGAIYTVTQSAPTRDASGRIVNQPPLLYA